MAGMFEWLALTGIFLVTTGTAYLVMRRARRGRLRLASRLRTAHTADEPQMPPRLLLGTLTPALAAQIPMTRQALADLQDELLAAGFYRPTALLEYRALRTVLVLLPLVAGGVAALLVSSRQEPMVLGAGVVGAVLSFSLPRIYLFARAKARARKIARGLPFGLDLLTLCLSAGQNIFASLDWVSRHLRFSYRELAFELEITRRHAELHSVVFALQQMAGRVHVPEVRDLALILAQSERLGADTAAALLEFSEDFSLAMRRRAESQANRATFWMLFPTLFCLWIASGILLIGPVYFDFWQQRRAGVEFLREAGSTVRDANTPVTQP